MQFIKFSQEETTKFHKFPFHIFLQNPDYLTAVVYLSYASIAYIMFNVIISLYSALEPASLRQAICPTLSSYSSLDTEAEVHQSLSRSVFTSERPIFLLDAYTDLLVYYLPTASPSIPFPPPRDCEFSTIFFKCHLVVLRLLHFLPKSYSLRKLI